MRLILLLSLIACDGAPSSDAKDDTDATPNIEETDVADETEVPMDTEVEEVVTPHDCLDNHGIHGLTSRWSYSWKNSNRTGGRGITVTGYDNERNRATLSIQSAWTDAAATFSEVRVVQYVCDASYLYVVSQTVDSTLDLSLVDPTVVSDSFTYDEPVRVQANATLDPPNPTMWTKRTHGTRVDRAGNASDFDSSVMCWLVQADQAGYTPFLPDHYQCGSPPVFPNPEPDVTEEYRWEEGIGVVNDWDTRLTEHVE